MAEGMSRTPMPPARDVARVTTRLVLLGLVLLSAYYLYRAVHYRFVIPNRLGPSLFDKQLWYVTHVVAALPVLIGAPLQFLPSLRSARPALHRWIGRVYVIGAAIAGSHSPCWEASGSSSPWPRGALPCTAGSGHTSCS